MGENAQNVDDYTRFIRTTGHIVVQCPHLDIVQLGLQQPKSSAVYKDSLVYAKAAKDQFYVEW